MCKKLLPLLLLLCSSCSHSITDPPALSQPQLAAPSLATVTRGQTIEIYNDWNGYSDITPVLRHYKLQRQQQQFVGNAYVAIGGYGAGGIHQQKTTAVKIPTAVTSKFLDTLAKTPIQVGTYKPARLRTDDYPHVKIQVQIDRQQTTFNSKSQGVGYAPWQITIRQGNITKQYISNSTVPAQALKILSPYIDRPEIDKIIKRRQQKKS
ncbi:MAG: hypothetical protein RLZZ135_366 [Cyanobacteriota bacterium]